MSKDWIEHLQWVLFDADDTLFHFDAFSGLTLMMQQYQRHFTEQDYQQFQALNQPLWLQYQQGDIAADELKVRRFTQLGAELQVDPALLNRQYLQAMAQVCPPLPGAIELLQRLKGNKRLGIITNGFTDLQQVRLERAGLQDHFDLLVISEQVGAAKPSPKIYQHALEQMGQPDPATVLMVGDNPVADIAGGQQMGFYTCFMQHPGKALPAGIQADLTVCSLSELVPLF
ncbi:pyrimidine 5'-nucleotidase [Rheinheimera marina]|uniref:Pyrimidine 5'-nucleotidase n=1 Tax=Rheinheimera marina TaxID=1774958 RepID=A0ABV9JLE4_9GAMM